MIPPDVIPGRMTLLITLFLVLISIFNNVWATSPKVSGFSALSAWLLSCMLFVFGALLGYAGILFNKHILPKVLHGVYCHDRYIKMVNGTNMCLNQLCYIVYLDTTGNGLAQRIGSKIPKSCRTWIQKSSQKNKKCRLSFPNLFSDDVFDL